ncbi:MAG: aspartyl protease family protein [Planctomycetota bacterium]|jgi:hypothetical protein
MKRMNSHNSLRALLVLLFLAVVCGTSAVRGQQRWKRHEVNWQMTGGSTIKAVNYPEGESLPLLDNQDERRPTAPRKKTLQTKTGSGPVLLSATSTATVTATVIDSPPVDGFVPWIAVTVTDKRSDDFDWVAESHMSVVGNYLTDSLETDFTIGLFDTGAAAHLMSYAAANHTGIYAADLVTANTTEILGATHSVFARVSQPLAIFMVGLAAIDPNAMTLDKSNMVGQSNVSIIVGDMPPPDKPDLPTAIGSPMSVNFVTAIYNDHPITVTYDGNDYTSPDIQFYDHNDSRIPDYANNMPLNLIPSGAVNIQYIPSLDDIMDFAFQPGTPSIIVGNLSQSLFFVDSVDLHNGAQSAIDKQRFMLDTGAQVTVISTGIGSRLGLNPADADFELEIQDVTGEITIEPGFYIDSLEIPALGEWLSFTNIPVVLLDVGSPEGGFLDGIIGTNLFTRFNLVLHGGGLLGQDPPSLGFELIYIIADIAPAGGDGVVNSLDLAAFAEAWLATTESANWNPNADMAPAATKDGLVNFLDFAVFAEDWPSTTAQ